MIDFLLSGVCHQIPERCVMLTGGRINVCYRCAGLFLGLVITLTLLLMLEPGARQLPSRRQMAVLSPLAALWAADGLNSALFTIHSTWALYVPNTILRLYTGAGMGLALGVVLCPIAQLVWTETNDGEPVLSQWTHALIVVSASILAATMLLHHAPDSLVFWQIVITGAVFSSIATVNTLMVMLLHSNRSRRLKHLIYALCGIGLTIAETSLIAGFRVISGI